MTTINLAEAPLAMGANSFSPEFQLLLCCASAEADEQRLVEILADPLDWERLLHLAKRHKLRPLLYRYLKKTAFFCVPPLTVQRLSSFAQANERRNLGLIAQLRTLLRLFQDNGVKALTLKGPFLAAHLYGDLSLREFHDLDVFIERRQAALAHSLLVSWGCRLTLPAVRSPVEWEEQIFLRLTQENVYTYLLPDGRSHLELHWALIPPCLGCLCEFDEAWSRHQTISAGNLVLSGLRDGDLLLYLAAHGAKHRWKRLEWLGAFRALANQAGNAAWEHAWKIARRTHSARLLHLAVSLSAAFWDAPAHWHGAASEKPVLPAKLANTVIALMRQDIGPEQSVADFLFYLESRERFLDRLVSRARLAVYPSFHDLAALPEPLQRFPVYLLARPIRLVKKYLVPSHRGTMPV